jgi:hypothetical protein
MFEKVHYASCVVLIDNFFKGVVTLLAFNFYANIIKMFIRELLNNLPQALKDNTWAKHPTNQNYRM